VRQPVDRLLVTVLYADGRERQTVADLAGTDRRGRAVYVIELSRGEGAVRGLRIAALPARSSLVLRMR
jgi:hypothetical protein